MVQYDVLKEKWHAELRDALSLEGSNSEEMEKYLNPSYCLNNNLDAGLEENNSIEIQQQLIFAKIEAQVIWKLLYLFYFSSTHRICNGLPNHLLLHTFILFNLTINGHRKQLSVCDTFIP